MKHNRLVTLTGSGGTGKTRLAVQVAAGVLDQFSDGVWLADLAPLANPDSIAYAIASVFNLTGPPDVDYNDLLHRYLHGKRLLLLLDNCEHLIDGCARLAYDLLSACPRLAILVTSRESLSVTGETVYRVPSLVVPDLDRPPQTEEFLQVEAVRLFTERAAAALPGFAILSEDFADIAHICVRLDGIPLAIELAAVRVSMFSAAQIAARLDDRFRLLTGGSRTALPRQRTLRASIDWSYSLLNPNEQALLQRLSVFSGGFTFEAAEAVCSSSGSYAGEVFDTLFSLLEKSLVVTDRQPRSTSRCHLLETIRQYTQEKLADSGDAPLIRERHLEYYLRVVDELEPQFITAQVPQALDQLDAELENLRSAMGWALSKGTQAGYIQELRLFNGLWRYWHTRALLKEGMDWGLRGLERLEAVDNGPLAELRGWASFHLGHMIGESCYPYVQVQDWLSWIEKSAAIFRMIGNNAGLALALAYTRLGLIAIWTKIPVSDETRATDVRAIERECLAAPPQSPNQRPRVSVGPGQLPIIGSGHTTMPANRCRWKACR